MNTLLPESFKSILWSYKFEECDPTKMKKTIIVQALLYGNLSQLAWIREFYGDEEIKHVLSIIPATEIRPKTRNLIEILFDFSNWNYAQRSLVQ